MKGTIKRIHPNGYGFIISDDGRQDIFFHARDVVGTEFNALQENEDVTFEIGDSPKGPKAVNVTINEEPNE